MKAIVVTDQAAGTAGMTLVERPEPPAAINDVVVEVHSSGFVPTELAWPSTWTDRLGRNRTPSIPGHELAGVVTALGYGTTGLSVGQRVFGLTDWHRDGTLAEYVAVEARNLAPLPGDVDFTAGASLPISGLTAWQGLFEHGRLQAGQSVLVHGAAGAVGSMVTQLAREFGAYVIGTGRAADRQKALDFGAQEFVDLENDALEDVGGVDLVFDVIGGDIQQRSAGLVRAGGTLVSVVGPAEARPADGLAVDFVVESDRAQLGEVVQRVRDGRLRANIGNVATLEDAVAALNPTERSTGRRSSTFAREDSGTATGSALLVDQRQSRGEAWPARRRRHRRSQAQCRKPLTDGNIPWWRAPSPTRPVALGTTREGRTESAPRGTPGGADRFEGGANPRNPRSRGAPSRRAALRRLHRLEGGRAGRIPGN